MKTLRSLFTAALAAVCVLVVAGSAAAQAPTIVSATTPTSPIVLVPISATAAVNTQTTLTIPAPPGGMYNYVCFLAFQVNQDGTGGTAYSVAVTTSTNFPNSFAAKFSMVSTASTDSGVITLLKNDGAAGCAKSTQAGTATTFVGPSANTHAAWTWYATYYQAP